VLLNRQEYLDRAAARLALPPAYARIQRHPGRGTLVAAFVLPLELAAPANASRHASGWTMAAVRSVVLEVITKQLRSAFDGELRAFLNDRRKVAMRALSPLPGRPQLRAVRFSSVEPDATAAWWKVPVDVLLPARQRRGATVEGIGLLRDDRPAVLETCAWWEPAPPSEGFVVIEIWSGEVTL
jgi:hypothetical protein